MSGPRPIVVGVDGSAESQHALDWALDEALLGSVSDACVRRATVPVVVLPAGARRPSP